jgi:type I restriction enzyme R subunit
MRITGDDELGKAQLDNFINPKKAYPVIATTSELMTTGVDAKTCKLVVLDQNIQSMTKFKQIIGRGTRIDDRYNKLWFTILDFKKATELFADEAFDGPPEKVMVSKSDDIIDLDNAAFDEELASSVEYGSTETEPGEVEDTRATYDASGASTASGFDGDWGNDDDDDRFVKYHVSGVSVKKMAERVQYYDSDGKLVTESFKDYTRNTVLKQFASLDEFVKSWKDAERKQVIIDELEEAGVIWQALEEDVSKDMGPFDLICHVVYDQPPLTRKERADNVKKRNYFTKYNEAAQQVLNNLLDKYADVGVTEIESKDVLKVSPFDKMGRPLEIVKNAFGSPHGYKEALSDLERALYDDEKDSA